MGTVLASKIAADAAKLLFDLGYNRHFETDHLNYINIGQRQAVLLKPDISVSNTSVIMVEGTLQTISSTGISLVKLTRNMGTDGVTPGEAIRPISLEDLDMLEDDWYTASASATIKRYVFDPRDPKHFYVYPPQPATGFGYAEQVEVIIPTDIAAIGNAITLDDIYESILFHYDLYMCYSIDAKQSEYANQKATFHYGMFAQLLMGKEVAETRTEPKLNINFSFDGQRSSQNPN